MDLLNSMVWLCVGVMIGWFANRFVTTQIAHRANKMILSFVDLSIEDKNLGLKDAPILSPQSAKRENESHKEQFFANDSLGG